MILYIYIHIAMKNDIHVCTWVAASTRTTPGPALAMRRAAQLTVEPSRHISRRRAVPTKPEGVRRVEDDQ
jgi:hypothetical protein